MRQTTQSKTGTLGPAIIRHLSENERRRANAYMRDGELIAEVYCRARAGIQSAAGRLARGAKAMFARPVRH